MLIVLLLLLLSLGYVISTTPRELEVGFAFFLQRATVVIGVFLEVDALAWFALGFADFNACWVNPGAAIGKEGNGFKDTFGC